MENVKLIVKRSFKVSKLFKNVFIRCMKNFMCIFIHKYSLVKVYQIINLKNLILEEKNGKFHIDDRYVRYLKKLGVQVSLKVEGEGED